jgi:hypothetical protein
VSSLTSPKRINAISTAPTAPNATSATGLRYQGRSGSVGGRPGSPTAGTAAGHSRRSCPDWSDHRSWRTGSAPDRNGWGRPEVRSAPRALIVSAQGSG